MIGNVAGNSYNFVQFDTYTGPIRNLATITSANVTTIVYANMATFGNLTSNTLKVVNL